MRSKQEIRDERDIDAAWRAISHVGGAARDIAILAYATEGTPAVRAWVELKFMATLAELRKSGRAKRG